MPPLALDGGDDDEADGGAHGKSGAAAVEVAEEDGEDEVVRVNTALVTIPVSILDRDGRFIPNLRKKTSAFSRRNRTGGRLLRHGRAALHGRARHRHQQLDALQGRNIQDAAIAIPRPAPARRPRHVVSFDEEIRFLSEATSDRRQLRDAIRRTRHAGHELYDAVDIVIKQRLDHIKGRKAPSCSSPTAWTRPASAPLPEHARRGRRARRDDLPHQYDTHRRKRAGERRGVVGPSRAVSGGKKESRWCDILAGIIIGGGPGVGRGSPYHRRREAGGGAVVAAAAARPTRSTGAAESICASSPRSRAGVTTRPTTSATSDRHSTTSRKSCAASTASATTPPAPRRPPSAQLKVRVKRPTSSVRARVQLRLQPSGRASPRSMPTSPRTSTPPNSAGATSTSTPCTSRTHER